MKRRSGITKIVFLSLQANFPTKWKKQRKSMVFGCSEAPFSRLGRLLGTSRGWFWASWSVLEAFWSVWGASWGVLGRLGASWARFEAPKEPKRASAVPGTQPCLAAGNPPISKKKRHSTARKPPDLYRAFYTNANTHLGPFGPGADLMRSRAAYPPLRLTCKIDTKIDPEL